MKAMWNGEVIAESDKTLEVGGYLYFPRDIRAHGTLHTRPRRRAISNVRTACSSTTSSRDGTRSARAAWSYEAPQEKMKPVDHWIGFWEDVKVE